MAYEMVMPYHLHMPSYFLETFTEYPLIDVDNYKWTYCSCYYGYLTEGLASLILTCHQYRFQLDKFFSITNAFCLQLEKMLFRFF